MYAREKNLATSPPRSACLLGLFPPLFFPPVFPCVPCGGLLYVMLRKHPLSLCPLPLCVYLLDLSSFFFSIVRSEGGCAMVITATENK